MRILGTAFQKRQAAKFVEMLLAEILPVRKAQVPRKSGPGWERIGLWQQWIWNEAYRLKWA